MQSKIPRPQTQIDLVMWRRSVQMAQLRKIPYPLKAEESNKTFPSATAEAQTKSPRGCWNPHQQSLKPSSSSSSSSWPIIGAFVYFPSLVAIISINIQYFIHMLIVLLSSILAKLFYIVFQSLSLSSLLSLFLATFSACFFWR